MNQRTPVSVCLIAGNEARRIRAALESVSGWVEEIIVLLNEDVNDGTDRIAESFGAKVFREPWKGHIAQKNSAVQKATQKWLLGLDADEAVSPALRSEIQEMFAQPDKLKSFAAFSFPRCTQYCGRWIRHGDWYPDHQTRLWLRGQAEWGGVNPHDKLIVNGRVARLQHDLLHFTNESIAHHLSKIAPFQAVFVKDRRASGRPVNIFELTLRPFWRFIRAYFLRRGFLDGWQGYYIAKFNAFSTLTKYAMVLEAETAEVERGQ
ncbi:MAG TPA: glycosyltransferase family 2 protein [Candidatus Acidoferrum sp.]|nr:glycosyltransferase family 2 protein [Candidatus Acidoferrum sp.]